MYIIIRHAPRTRHARSAHTRALDTPKFPPDGSCSSAAALFTVHSAACWY